MQKVNEWKNAREEWAREAQEEETAPKNNLGEWSQKTFWRLFRCLALSS